MFQPHHIKGNHARDNFHKMNAADLFPAKPAPSIAARRLLTVAAFVESHGFTATARDGAVFFRIPFTGPNGEQGSEGQRVETIAEARMALGY